MEAKSRRFQYWKRIQAGILFFVFLFGALFMGSAQHAFATERVGREEVTRVDGRGRDVAIREGGEDIVIVPSDPNTSVPEGYVRVSFNKGSYGNFGEGKQFIFFIFKRQNYCRCQSGESGSGDFYSKGKYKVYT